MINKVFCSVEKENGIKYSKVEKNHSDPVINKLNQVFDSIKNSVKEISNEKVMTALIKLNLLVMIL